MSITYVTEHYYDESTPFSFMQQTLRGVFPESVTIQEISELIPEKDIPEAKMCELEREIFEQLKGRARKAEYRTDDQTRVLARTDAKLFLSVYYLNVNDGQKGDRILSGSHYLITSSGRYLFCANKIGLKGKVTTRLQSIAGVLRTLGKIDMTPTEFMRLLENPFLIQAVNQSRDDIKGLVDAGVNLRGVSLPRLRRDLEEGLHKRITAMEAATERPVEDDDPTSLGDEEYLAVVEEAGNRGYGITTVAKELVKRLERAKEDYEIRLKLIDEYADAVETFGKRKRKYLKRMEQKYRKKK